MKYIYAASFLHESNTFSRSISDMAWFHKRCWKLGDEVLDRFRGVRTEFGGFIDALADCRDMKLIPIIAAEATPAGPVADEVVEAVHRVILDTLAAAPQVDAVLLSLHGAMVTESSEDGEGDLVQAIRQVVGERVPIYATLDLHANITEKMTANLDVMLPYDCYPHTDKYERGVQCAGLLVRQLRGECSPVMAVEKLPLLLPLIATAAPEMRPVARQIAEMEQWPGMLNVSLVHGFVSADIAACGASVVALSDGEPALARRGARALAGTVWESRSAFAASYCALEQLASLRGYTGGEGPVIVSDGPDNPGGGSYADGTHVLRCLVENRIDAVVALIYDPESVERCRAAGEGNTVQLELGGKRAPDLMGEPLACTARVLKLTDGRYRNHGPMNPGLQMDLLGTALIDIGGVRVIVVKNPTQPYDTALMELHGIQPEQERVIVLKSAVHFRAAYEPMAKDILLLSYPGICKLNPKDVRMCRCRRPVYPLDPDMTYDGML